MQCFEVVRRFLDTTYESLGGSDEERDRAFVTALGALASSYSQLRTRSKPDYSQAPARFAYVYKYVGAHGCWIDDLLDRTPPSIAGGLFDDDLHMFSLGGGPGTDLLGVLRHMAKSRKTTRVECAVVDICSQWKDTWNVLQGAVHASQDDFIAGIPNFNANYIVPDTSSKSKHGEAFDVPTSRLVTLSFFCSELYYSHPKLLNAILNRVITTSPPGALFLYNDNKIDQLTVYIDETAQKHDLRTIEAGEDPKRFIDSSEEKTVVAPYEEKVKRLRAPTGYELVLGDTWPKRSGKVTWRIFQKSKKQ